MKVSILLTTKVIGNIKKTLKNKFNYIIKRDINKITYENQYEELLASEDLIVKYQIEIQKEEAKGDDMNEILIDIYNTKIKNLEGTAEEEAKVEGVIQKWENNPSGQWKELASLLVKYYLLNVRQGFWINHSIKFIMKTILYLSNDYWIENDIESNLEIKDKLETKDKKLQAIYETINPKIKKLANLEKNNNLIGKIFSQEETLDNYYMGAYNVQNSIWLKLLYTFRHLGAKKKNENENENEINFDTTSSISFCNNLLLALSTRKDKAKMVKGALEFADILTKISNPACQPSEDESSNMGGGSKKSKRNIKIKFNC